MNASTAILLAVIIVGMVFAGRRMYRVFSLKDDCCGGGPKDAKAKRIDHVKVADTNEANYPYSLDMKVGDMTCDKCVERVQDALNAMPGTWARVDLESKMAHVLSKNPIDQDACERAIEEAGYFVYHR